MRRKPRGAAVMALTAIEAACSLVLLSGIGCSEAVHTLGTLPRGAGADARCENATTAAPRSSNHDGCGTRPPVADASTDARDEGDGGGDRDGGGGGRAGHGGTSGGAGGKIGNGGANDGGTCTPLRAVATRRGLNILLLVDDSLSTVLQAVWGSLTAAISDFVDDPANRGIGVGIEYYGLSCNTVDYATPVVPIALLPGSAPAIKASYPPLPINGKAIAPALAGAASYARGVIAHAPDRTTEIVLVTDGVLDPLCGSSAASTASTAASAAKGTPPVRIHVVALSPGPTLINPGGTTDFAPLDGIATAGGTTTSVHVEVSATTNTALTVSLDSLVAESIPCSYAIPAGIDASRAALEWQPAPSQPRVSWPRVSGAGACGARAAAFPSATPSSAGQAFLDLCPAACSALRASPSGTVWAVEACATP